MIAVFRHALVRSIGQIIGWGIALALLGIYGMLLYDTLVEPQAQQQFEQLISSYPPELMTFFGDMTQMFTPGGYLDTLFFSYIPIIIGIFVIVSCASLLAGDEEKGLLDLVLAHPVSRVKLFYGRLGAYTVSVILILFITWIGFALPLPKTSMQVSAWELFLPFLSLFALLMFFGRLSLLLSMVLPSRQWAVMTSGLILVTTYFLTSLARLSEKLKPIERYFPMHYYQGGKALTKMDWGWFGFLFGCSILFTLLALWSFERRDIRVSGEAGWHITGFRSHRTVRFNTDE
jgi:beta-exotoxin I transport system permease protein